jgi:hypothetical protein
MTDTVVLIPVLRRPHRVAPVLETIRSTSDARALFICSPNDRTEHEAVITAGADLMVVPFGPDRGDYARKINYGYRATTEPNIFLGADDLHFHDGWHEAVEQKLDGKVGVVGTNDLSNARVQRGEHATHSLVTRAYADRYGTIDHPGEILHEGYWHEFVDDELLATAKFRKLYAHASDAHVEHLHPLYGKAPTDPLYDEHAMRMRIGREVFARRSPLWTA